MSTLFLDKEDLFAKAEQDTVVIYQDGVRKSGIPMACLEAVVIKGKCTIESSLLGKLGEHQVAVIVLSGRKNQVSLMLPSGAQGVEKRLAQFKAIFDEDLTLEIAKIIVKNKLQSQRDLLAVHLERARENRHVIQTSISDIDRHIESIDAIKNEQDLLGLEGVAAANYFKAFSSCFPEALGFHERNRRPPRDPVNACLSLGYTLLYGVASLVCNEHGFDSMIGFYHKPLSGRHSLACDVVEPVRTVVDQMVFNLFHSEVLRNEEFTVSEDGCLMTNTAKGHLYGTFQETTEEIRKAISKELAAISSLLENKGIFSNSIQ